MTERLFAAFSSASMRGAFVYYHNPGSNHYHRIVSFEAPKEYASISDLPLSGGYVIMPFTITEESPLLFISPDEERREPLPVLPPSKEVTCSVASSAAELSDYGRAFSSAHRRVKDGELDKVVLSRRLRVRRPLPSEVSTLFFEACHRRPNCFTALWFTPRSGLWLTATPEPLLVGEGEEWHTVALAGTQPNGDSSSVLWDDKNREEQALVARFITDKLTPLTKDLNVSETRTVEAGNVCHLCTDFSFRLSGEDDIKAILTALHPTPAVCGHPRQEALKAILEDEISPRRYYAGFSGPLALHGTTRLYVSLRCMYRDEEEAVLYAGGGIMPESRMEAEWQETERKLQTMLGLL